jgi:HSP20 family protein
MARISSVQMQWWSMQSGPRSIRINEFYPLPAGAGVWQPAINAFRCDRCIRICVDLAGVDRSQIEVSVEGRSLLVRGVRTAPEPAVDDQEARQILALEIDSGPFARELALPVEVDVKGITAQQREGLLWITLPLLQPS